MNSDVERAKKRLDKQLALLRGHSMANDPKTAQEIVDGVRRRERARSGAGEKKKGPRRPRSPLKGMFLESGEREGEGGIGGGGKLTLEGEGVGGGGPL